MSGALLPLKTYVNASQALWAAAGSGGGGSVSTFNTLTVSSLQGLSGSTLDIIGNLQVNGGVIQFSGGPSVIENSVITTSSLVVSSINGLAPGGGGGSVSSFQTASVSSLTVSSINGSEFQPAQLTTTVAPTAVLNYIQGGQAKNLFVIGGIQAQHSYQLTFPAKVSGWNAADGLTPSYAPGASDFLSMYPFGNVVGNPAPVAVTLQMAQVSSLNNDWEGTVTCAWKTTAPGANLFQASTSPGVGYSTSVEIGAFGYLTDFGQI